MAVSCASVRSKQPFGHPHVYVHMGACTPHLYMCPGIHTPRLSTCLAMNFARDKSINTSIEFSVLLQREVKKKKRCR